MMIILSSSFTSSPPGDATVRMEQKTVPVGLGKEIPILPQMASKNGISMDDSEVSHKQQDLPRCVCGYNLTAVPNERKLSDGNLELGFVLYVKNQVKKRGKIVKKNNVIGIEDIGNGNASGDEDNFFFLTSAWMEGGKWVDETETKTICDNCEESECTFKCDDCQERFCKQCCENIHRGGKRKLHNFYEV